MKANTIRKRLFSVLLSAAMIGSVGAMAFQAAEQSSIQVYAAESAENSEISSNGFKYSIEDGKAILTKYTGSQTVIKIPAEINGYPVIGIGQKAFYSKSKITSVTIPTTVRFIGDDAFAKCSKLEKVSLFSRKSALAANKCDLVYIGKRAFLSCVLGSVYIPDSVVYIDSKAFENDNEQCVVNGDLYIGDSVYSVGDEAFSYGTTGVTAQITGIRLGDSLRYIGRKAFAGEKKMPGGAIFIPSTVVGIDSQAFIGSEGCGEGEQLLREIADVSGGFDDVVKKARQFASGDYVSYHLVSAENNAACEKYCSNDNMWSWNFKYNRPDYLVSDKMKNIATVSKTGAYVGDSVKLTAEAGDAQTTGQYYYKFIIQNIDTNKTVYSKNFYSDKNTYARNIKINKAGIYNVTVVAYTVDENGFKTRVNTAYRKMVVSDPLKNTTVAAVIDSNKRVAGYPLEDSDNPNTIVLNLTKNNYAGDGIRLLADSTGGVGYNSVSYSYTLKKVTGRKQYVSYDDSDYYDNDSVVYVEQSKISSHRIKFNTPGTYTLTVYARDAANRVVKKNFTVKVNVALGQTIESYCNKLNYDQDKFDNTQPSTYEFYYQKSGESKVLYETFSFNGAPSAKKAEFTPDSTGKYRIYVKRTQKLNGKTISAYDYFTFNVVE